MPAAPSSGGGDSQLHTVLGHGPPGQMNALLSQQIHQGLIAEGMGRVLLPHQLQQPPLHRLLGGAGFAHGVAEKVPQWISALGILSVKSDRKYILCFFDG